MDGSSHRWFSDSKATLHLAIDNATGTIVGAYFQKEETLAGYYCVYKQILKKIWHSRKVFYRQPHRFLLRNAQDKNGGA